MWWGWAGNFRQGGSELDAAGKRGERETSDNWRESKKSPNSEKDLGHRAS